MRNFVTAAALSALRRAFEQCQGLAILPVDPSAGYRGLPEEVIS